MDSAKESKDNCGAINSGESNATAAEERPKQLPMEPKTEASSTADDQRDENVGDEDNMKQKSPTRSPVEVKKVALSPAYKETDYGIQNVKVESPTRSPVEVKKVKLSPAYEETDYGIQNVKVESLVSSVVEPIGEAGTSIVSQVDRNEDGSPPETVSSVVDSNIIPSNEEREAWMPEIVLVTSLYRGPPEAIIISDESETDSP